MRRPLLSISLAAAVLLALAGCASSAYPAFDRPATEKDALPPDFDAIDTESFDLGTVRFAGSYKDVDYYMLRQGDANCVAIAAGEGSIIACGDGGGVTASVPGTYSAQLVPEPARDGNGWIAINENVRVKPNP